VSVGSLGAGISPSKYISGEAFYPSTGVWFPDVSERGMGASLIPFAAIPGRKALLAALPAGAGFTAVALAGFMNSILAEGLLGVITPERHHKPSYVGQLPWVAEAAPAAERHFRRVVDLISREAPCELSPFFSSPDVVRHRRESLAHTARWLRAYWTSTRDEIAAELVRFDAEILGIVRASRDDADLLVEMSQRGSVESWFPSEHDLNRDLIPQLAADLVSFTIGRIFGHHAAVESNGTASVRVRVLERFPAPAGVPGVVVLVDDEGHDADIVAAMKAVLDEQWGGSADLVLIELGAALAPSTSTLRSWMARSFFDVHRSRFTKSRRVAPIYWQLATPSASYSVWLYIHAFGKDTLFRVQNDYAAPKLAHEERRLESLSSELRGGATAAQRKALAAQEGVVGELRAFLEELKRVAPLWNPDLDDGVIINFALLWRLVPQDKAWQKELKSTWDALREGKSDWAQLAMHLWPERVVPKCAIDRSLAIAHGLEDVFWTEDSNCKWTARKTPTRPINELVRERASPAVKAALQGLIDAPVAGGNGSRSGRRRAVASEGKGKRGRH